MNYVAQFDLGTVLPKNFYESKLLRLNSNKAKKKLGWKPVLNFEASVKMIINWYKNYIYRKKTF